MRSQPVPEGGGASGAAGVSCERSRPDVADDLVQDVFERALRQIQSLRDAKAFGGWLIQIARNRVRDHWRREPVSEELQERRAEARAPSQSEAEAALDAIRALPEAYRETLLLRLVEGMTGPEIAARVGMTPESVRVNLHRGMKMLRERIGQQRS